MAPYYKHRCKLFRGAPSAGSEYVKQDDVRAWLADLVERFLQWAQRYKLATRRLLVRPDMPLEGFVAKRKLDVGFVNDPKANETAKHYWLRILIPGGLKSNPKEDLASKAHLDIARDVKEVFTVQPTRRFVLVFTLCRSWMRLWEFDRLGGIASERFNIHKYGQCFLSTVLGFLWMDDEAVGFDATIIKSVNGQYIEIKRDIKTERLVLDKLIGPAHSIVGRATTCLKAYLEGDKSRSFVIKESWQFPECDEEGKLLSASPTKAGNEPLPNRIYRRIVLSNYGEPICKASSRAALLSALEGCS
ncbi:hypothetical protein F4859DRAFT_525055 [Xylaria cf. heliscus]|nr:hypothetical protein F4859DRAFT_525055 [Xylaria cf. heliscus]